MYFYLVVLWKLSRSFVVYLRVPWQVSRKRFFFTLGGYMGAFYLVEYILVELLQGLLLRMELCAWKSYQILVVGSLNLLLYRMG